jgi:histidine kinase
MIDELRSRLSVKLLISYLVIIVLVVLVIVSATQITLPGAFDRHLRGMGPQIGAQRNPPGPNNPPPPARDMMRELYNNFRASFNDALTYALLASGLAAVAVSLLFSRGVVAPLRAMMKASRRIAEGHYDERVRVTGSDELAQLGVSFNSMAERLEQTESMRRQLLGDVSHELRTPLTAIGGYMEGLIDGVLPATPETYEQVRHEALRLGRLVDDLQELSRVESGSFHLNLRTLNLSVPLGTAVKRLQRQFDEKRVELNHNLPPDPSAPSGQVLPPVQADEDRLTQMLTNLLANALVYTPAGGQVNVTARRVGSELHISVADSGIGIPVEHLPHIFDRFYRVDKSRSRGAGGGSGIGLTIVHHLVEAHGGRIWAESAGENKGSVFTFTLPVGKV